MSFTVPMRPTTNGTLPMLPTTDGTLPRGPYAPTWKEITELPEYIRKSGFRYAGPGLLQPTQIEYDGPLLNEETLASINRILVTDINNHFIEGGHKYAPLDILGNDTYARLVATYIFLNGPNPYIELGKELGIGLDPMTGGRRRKNRTKKSSRRRHR